MVKQPSNQVKLDMPLVVFFASEFQESTSHFTLVQYAQIALNFHCCELCIRSLYFQCCLSLWENQPLDTKIKLYNVRCSFCNCNVLIKTSVGLLIRNLLLQTTQFCFPSVSNELNVASIWRNQTFPVLSFPYGKTFKTNNNLR